MSSPGLFDAFRSNGAPTYYDSLEEKKRQLSLIRRVEKIKVEYTGIPEDCTLQMNKDLSTPYNCAMHMKSNIKTLAALALVNGEVWDMHRPLESDCSLEFLKFRDSEPAQLNRACWRTGSFILGYIFDRALKDETELIFYVFLITQSWRTDTSVVTLTWAL